MAVATSLHVHHSLECPHCDNQQLEKLGDDLSLLGDEEETLLCYVCGGMVISPYKEENQEESYNFYEYNIDINTFTKKRYEFFL